LARDVLLMLALRHGAGGKKSQRESAMDAWIGLAMIVEVLLLSVVLALMLTWWALRAVLHLLPATAPAARTAPALVARRTSASAA